MIYAMLKTRGCFLVQDLVTALPLANGHGSLASHFGESNVNASYTIGFVVVKRACLRAHSLAPITPADVARAPHAGGELLVMSSRRLIARSSPTHSRYVF